MGKAKDIRIDNMVSVSPVTDNQKKAFQDYKLGKNLSSMVLLELVKHLCLSILHCKKF